MTSYSRSEKGYTMIELVIVALILGVLAKYMYDGYRPGLDAQKSDATMQKLEGLKKAILGGDSSQTTTQSRTKFGFVGDIGRLPTGIGELSTQGALPTWAYSTVYAIGAGWRGPYVSSRDTLATDPAKDAWGQSFVYSSTLPTPYIQSYGADKVAGGTAANTDLLITMQPTEWRARVSGNLRDGNDLVSGATVQIWYPSAGALTSSAAVTDANGYFSFSSIPFGTRTLRVTSPVASGPRPISVESSEVVVPDSVLNLTGASEGLTVVTGSARSYNSGQRVLVDLASSYSEMLAVGAIKLTYAGGATYSKIVVNGIAQTFAATASGATRAITTTMVFPPNSPTNSFEILFSGDMTGVAITALFTWVNLSTSSSVTFTP